MAGTFSLSEPTIDPPILKDYLTHNSMMEVAHLAMKQAERKSKRGSED